jgi:hypothetical protein
MHLPFICTSIIILISNFLIVDPLEIKTSSIIGKLLMRRLWVDFVRVCIFLLTSAYLFALQSAGNIVPAMLLACSVLIILDDGIKIYRVWAGRYGDEDYELEEIVPLIIAWLSKFRWPDDPNRTFPPRKLPKGHPAAPESWVKT